MTDESNSERSFGLTVGDIMSRKIYAAGAQDPVSVVLGRIRGHGFHHMPVVDDRGELLGIVSDRDLLAAVHEEPERTIRDVMTRLSASVSPATPARSAADTLLALRVGCLPVLDDGHLVGVVTATDFLCVAQRALSLLEMVAAAHGEKS
jgi:CBS domain-containing membrane protein